MGARAPDFLMHDESNHTDVALSSLLDGRHTIVLYWYCALRCDNEHCRNCHERAPRVAAATRRVTGANTGTKLCFVRIMGERSDATSFASAVGDTANHAIWLASLDPQPEYGVDRLPHVAVIHRTGLVVRNGDAADLDTLLVAMAAEPPEDEPLQAPSGADAPPVSETPPHSPPGSSSTRRSRTSSTANEARVGGCSIS